LTSRLSKLIEITDGDSYGGVVNFNGKEFFRKNYDANYKSNIEIVADSNTYICIFDDEFFIHADVGGITYFKDEPVDIYKELPFYKDDDPDIKALKKLEIERLQNRISLLKIGDKIVAKQTISGGMISWLLGFIFREDKGATWFPIYRLEYDPTAISEKVAFAILMDELTI
jgi:hypothetical protein